MRRLNEYNPAISVLESKWYYSKYKLLIYKKTNISYLLSST